MLLNPDRGAAKRAAALASPASYVELTVNVAAGVPYRLWLRSRATNNAYANDSIYLQFSGAVDAAGTPLARIGTTSALSLILEDRRDAGVAGWGWSDAGYEDAAPPIYFAQAGPDHSHPAARGRGRLGPADSQHRGVHVECRDEERYDDRRRGWARRSV